MKVKKNTNLKNFNKNQIESEEDVEDRMDDEESIDNDSDSEETLNMLEEGGVNDDSDGSSEADEELDASATESDDDDSEDEDIKNEENDEELDASATESDDEGSEDEDNKTPMSKSERIKQGILEKYQETNGKRLYIRFPRSIPSEELVQKAKDLSPLITEVNKPRQKHSRFCMVHFKSQEDRDATLKNLNKRIKKGELEKYQVDIPKTENADFVERLVEMKLKSIENKKLKARLKRASKKAGTLNTFTSSVLVYNLPKTATVIQLRELFPTAVDINIKKIKGGANKDKSVASITLPSTMEARAAVKNKMLSMGGEQLTVKFGNQKVKKKATNKPKMQHTGSKESKLPTKANQKPLNKKSKPQHQVKKQKGPILKTTLDENNSKSTNKRKLPQAEVEKPSKKLKGPKIIHKIKKVKKNKK